MANTTCIRNPAGQWTSAIAEMVLVDSPVLILVPSTTWKLENEDKAFRNQAGSSQRKENSYQLEFSLISSMKRPAELQIHNSELKTWAAPCCLLTHHTGKLSFSTANSCSNLLSMWRCQNRCSCEDCIVSDNQLKATILKYFAEEIQSRFRCDLSQMMKDIFYLCDCFSCMLLNQEPHWLSSSGGKKQKRGQTQDATQDLFLPLLLQVMKTQ